jgi:hypothetical protein
MQYFIGSFYNFLYILDDIASQRSQRMNKILIIIFYTPKEYEQELNVRGKNKKEKLVDIFSSFQKTGDELLLSSTQKDIDEFFEAEKTFLVTYNQQLKEACIKARLGTTMPS